MSGGADRLAELEAKLRTLADRVRSELPERARALRAALATLETDESGSRSAIARLAHMIRGSVGSHGITGLTEPAARVEADARKLAKEELVTLVHALADRLDAAACPPDASPTPPPSAATAPSASGLVKPLAGRRVLVIDDDAPTRRLLSMTLANLGGASASIEESPSAFFAALDAGHFDAVIVDAMMPEMNGLTCLQRIAGSPAARPETRYFVLSAAAPEELRWELPPALHVGWLRKPFRPRELLDALRDALARS